MNVPPYLRRCTLHELSRLVNENPRDRKLLEHIHQVCKERNHNLLADIVAQTLGKIESSSAGLTPAEALPDPSRMQLPQLERYFRSSVFQDLEKLNELLGILNSRSGEGSQRLADEVRSRIAFLASKAAPPKPQAFPKPPAAITEARVNINPLWERYKADSASYQELLTLREQLRLRGFGDSTPTMAGVDAAITKARQSHSAPTQASRSAVPSHSTPTHPRPAESTQQVPYASPGLTPPPRVSVAITSSSFQPAATSMVPPPGVQATSGPGTSIGRLTWAEELERRKEERARRGLSYRATPYIDATGSSGETLTLEFGRPQHLLAAVAKLSSMRQRAPRPALQLSAEVFEEMAARLRAASWESERQRQQDRRLLPLLMLAGSPPYLQQIGIAPFVAELSAETRLSRLRDLIQTYFDRKMAELPQERFNLGQWIRQRLLFLPEEKRRRDWVRHYLQHDALFTPSAVSYCVGHCSPDSDSWERWESLQLPRDSWIYRDALVEYTRLRTEGWQSHSRSLENLYSYLQRTEVQQSPGYAASRPVNVYLESEEIRRHCIEASLKVFVQQPQSPAYQPLISFALDTLKDPRNKGELAWYGVDERCRELMQSWLSIEDLELFFGELADDSDEKSRVHYWKPFVMKRLVSNSRIYIGMNLLRRKRGKIERYYREGRYGKLIGPNTDELCAFVLQIRDAIVVEFSKVNNACFVYDRSRFANRLFAESAISVDDLKDQRNHRLRMSHNHNWPSKFDSELYRNYQIQRPR